MTGTLLSPFGRRTRCPEPAAQRGLSLLELMVAMLLGLLVTAGIVALFSATNQTNKVQAAMSRIQENGRFAMARIEADLRMAGVLFRQTSGGSLNWMNRSEAALLPRNAILVNVTDAALAADNTQAIQLRDLGTATGRLAEWSATEVYPLGPAFFIRGYECATGTCVPTVPTGTNGLPDVGTTAGSRVRGADVLTVKYMRDIGWRYTVPAGATGYAAALTVNTTVAGETARTFNFASKDLVLVTDCTRSEPMLFQATVAGTVLTPAAGTLRETAKFMPGSGSGKCDARVFNFSRDFVTVSYWLQWAQDPNPSAAAGRLIPVLMRSENGNRQELAQGVDRLDFIYGVAMQSNGGVAFMTATEVDTYSAAASSGTSCPLPPKAFDRAFLLNSAWREPGCLWRSLRAIEVHALFNTIDDFGTMAPQDMAYWYSIDGGSGPVVPGATIPVTGAPAGRMMRREFVTLTSVRGGSQ